MTFILAAMYVFRFLCELTLAIKMSYKRFSYRRETRATRRGVDPHRDGAAVRRPCNGVRARTPRAEETRMNYSN